MRQNVRDLVEAFAGAFSVPEPVVEIGAFQVPGQEGFADLRPLFAGRRFIGCDLRSGPGVDRVEDVHRLTFADASVGTVVTVDTLEHVANPFLAVGEIHRVLRPGGLLLMISVMDFPIHDFPSDFWRFTPAAFRLLLEGFAFSLVGFQGDPLKPHTIVGVGARAAAPPREAVEAFLSRTPGTRWA